MKKLTLIVFLVFAGKFMFSQENLFAKIKSELKKEHPNLITENKLIAVSFWSVSDASSRETNIQMDKTVLTYKNAKLKGGSKGIISVLICVDSDATIATVTLGKDKIVNPVTINNIETTITAGTNYVFDSQGAEVYKNISSDKVFESIHKLITR